MSIFKKQEGEYQLLEGTLLTSFLAIDLADKALALGNRSVAESDFISAEEGYARILQHLPELGSGGQRHELEAELLRLREAVEGLENKLHP